MNHNAKWKAQPITRTRQFWIGVLVLSLVLLFGIFVLIDGGWNWALGGFGIGTDKSAKEPVINEYEPTSPLAETLVSYMDLLDTPDGVTYKPFKTVKQAVRWNRESILSWMLRRDFDLYVGNNTFISQVKKHYPDEQMLILIPAKDLETIVYCYLGGHYSITHRSTSQYVYLKDVKMYTTNVQIPKQTNTIRVEKLTESDHYYRLNVHIDNGISQARYLLVFCKRDDNSVYLLKLESY